MFTQVYYVWLPEFRSTEYRYNDEIEGINETHWDKTNLRQVVREIFQKWSQELLKVTNSSEQVQASAQVRQLTESRSAVKVYELAFFSNLITKDPLAKFVIRAHSDVETNNGAEREHEIVRHISQGTHLDYFSGKLYSPLDSVDNVVVYRHAEDELGETAQTLRDSIIQILEKPETEEVKTFAQALSDLMKAVISSYSDLGEVTLWDRDRFIAYVKERLMPDLVIDAYDRDVEVGAKSLIIFTRDGDRPGNRINNGKLVNIVKFLEEDRVPSDWFQVGVLRDEVQIERSGYLRLRSGKTRLWIRLKENFIGKLNWSRHQDSYISFKGENETIFLGEDWVQKSGYTGDATLSAKSLELICKDYLNSEVRLRTCHNDLHSRNVLCAPGRMKVVDLGSLDRDLLAVEQARLETSIWDEIGKRYDLENVEVSQILKNLQGEAQAEQDDLSERAAALEVILQSLREGANAGRGDISVPEKEIVLAYVIQVLVHQRYSVEKSYKATSVFNELSQYWLAKLQQLVVDDPPIADKETNVEDVATEKEVFRQTEDSKPTLYALWEKALQPSSSAYFEAQAESLLMAIVRRNRTLMNSPLTGLQQEIFERCLVNNPFHSEQHVILAAPTSSGKSTVAEMFLVGPPLLNTDRTRSLYIAPTRALTQAKYHELKERFASYELLANGIVLSTGEDADHDWRIAHGRFTIACMVYEKANILFSLNHRLLKQLGCIVIDEIHMLMDLERGPVLEMMLTKALQERRRSDFETKRTPRNNRDILRMVAISTEDEADQATKNFFQIRNPETAETVTPMILSDTNRPVPVRHLLVLPGTDGEPYETTLIIEFISSLNRMLSRDQLQSLNRKLLHQHGATLALRQVQYGSVHREMATRLNKLLMDILSDKPRGHRVLVFMPGRQQSLQNARRLKNSLKKKWNSSEKTRYMASHDMHVLKPLKTQLDNAEDKRMAKSVRECARYGILVHHSDIDKKIRFEIEDLCSTMPPSACSQVIFATETLSYGVNLTVHDVVMFGTEFHTQNRLREHQIQPLALCAFHNMVGRTGRLGKSGGISRVFVIVPYDQNGFDIVKSYYTTIEPPESRLYVSDDRNVQLSLEDNVFHILIEEGSEDPCAEYKCLGAQDFSYPFVRSVLDGLRHLNMVKSNSASGTGVTSQDLVEFMGKTLYARQKILIPHNKNELKLFNCAVDCILEDCANPPLNLVEADGIREKFYTITERGNAIIDTGTEIHTVEPLLKIVGFVQDAWQNVVGEVSLPAELYLLCIMPQEEVFRQNIYYAPECKKKRDWPSQRSQANRIAVFKSFLKALDEVTPLRFEEVQKLGKVLRDILDDWRPIQRISAGYVGGASDSLLRFFNGMVAWLNGEERSEVYRLMEGHELPDSFQGRVQGFRQFTELLNIKTLFLSKMMATGRRGRIPFEAEDERNLHLLATRLRFGCTITAIPLFWPFSSDFRREQAVKLLEADVTPSRMLSMAKPVGLAKVNIIPKKLKQLLEDLKKYAQNNFNELHAEMTISQASDEKREAMHRFWNGLSSYFSKSVEEYHNGSSLTLDFDGLVRNCFDFQAIQEETDEDVTPFLTHSRSIFSEHYQIHVYLSQNEMGISWYGKKISDESISYNDNYEDSLDSQSKSFDIDKIIHVVGVQFHSTWKCRVGKNEYNSLDEVIRRQQSFENLVIVPLPWMPMKSEMPAAVQEAFKERRGISGYSTSIVSPAAFAVMASCIVRDFVSSEACLNILAKPLQANQYYNTVSIRDVQEIVDSMPERHIPPSIRETLLKYFEVEF